MRSLERDARRAGGSSAAAPSTVAEWRGQRRQYVELLSRERSAFWTSRVRAHQSQPRRLWRSSNELLGRGRSPPAAISAADLHHYFDDKIADVRAVTVDADPSISTSARAGCELRVFSPMTQAEVIALFLRVLV